MVPPFPSDMTPDSFISTLEDTGFFDKTLKCLEPVYELDAQMLSTRGEVSDYLGSQYTEIAKSLLKKAAPSSGRGEIVLPFKLC